MAKAESKIRRYAALIYTCLVAVFLITGILLLVLVLKEENTLSNLKEESAALTEELATKDEAIASVSTDIENLQNIEDHIEEIKNTYFDNALIIENKARNGEEGYKVCFLTFDDGPYLLTNDYMDVLKEYDIQGTFFLVKRDGAKYDEIYERYKKEGHTIGNHTVSHEYRSIYASVENFRRELKENREFIEEKLGITTEVMRFPGGSYELTLFDLDRDAMMEMLNEEHYGYVDWNSLTGDAEGGVKDADTFYHRVVDNTNDASVLTVLMHDHSEYSLAALPRIIEELKNQGYTFLPLWYDSPTVRKQ